MKALRLFAIILVITAGSASHAQEARSDKPQTQQTINVTLKVTTENYKEIRSLFLKACSEKTSAGAQAADAVQASAQQAIEDADKFISDVKCEVPSDRPEPKQSDTKSDRFRDFFDNGQGYKTCDDAIYIKDVLTKFWPFLAIMNLSDACGFLSEPGKKAEQTASFHPPTFERLLNGIPVSRQVWPACFRS